MCGFITECKNPSRGMYFHKHNEKLIRPQKFVKVANKMKQKSCLQKVCKSIKVANKMKQKSCLQKVCKSIMA